MKNNIKLGILYIWNRDKKSIILFRVNSAIKIAYFRVLVTNSTSCFLLAVRLHECDTKCLIQCPFENRDLRTKLSNSIVKPKFADLLAISIIFSALSTGLCVECKNLCCLAAQNFRFTHIRGQCASRERIYPMNGIVLSSLIALVVISG